MTTTAAGTTEIATGLAAVATALQMVEVMMTAETANGVEAGHEALRDVTIIVVDGMASRMSVREVSEVSLTSRARLIRYRCDR